MTGSGSSMKTRAEKLDDVSHGRGTRKRSVTVGLSQLAFGALAGEERGGSVRAPVRTENAIRLYLSDRDSGRPAWPYPDFLRGGEAGGDVGLELHVDPDLWLQFEAEADKQGISVQQLLDHAAFYFAAELDAGRITQRILDDLDSTEAEGETR